MILRDKTNIARQGVYFQRTPYAVSYRSPGGPGNRVNMKGSNNDLKFLLLIITPFVPSLFFLTR